MAISTNPKPVIYRNLYENTGRDPFLGGNILLIVFNELSG